MKVSGEKRPDRESQEKPACWFWNRDDIGSRTLVVSTVLKGRNQIPSVETAIGIPVTFAPAGVLFGLVLPRDEHLNHITATKDAVKIGVADRCLQDILHQIDDIVGIHDRRPIEIESIGGYLPENAVDDVIDVIHVNSAIVIDITVYSSLKKNGTI